MSGSANIAILLLVYVYAMMWSDVEWRQFLPHMSRKSYHARSSTDASFSIVLSVIVTALAIGYVPLLLSLHVAASTCDATAAKFLSPLARIMSAASSRRIRSFNSNEVPFSDILFVTLLHPPTHFTLLTVL